MTQGALAEATSEDETERVDKQRISDIERGATQRLHSNTLMKLCDGLGITLDDLKAKEREFARAGKAEDTRKGDLGIALSFRRKLTAFREEYLVSDRGRVPFGGRDAELDQLNSWLFSEFAPIPATVHGAGRTWQERPRRAVARAAKLCGDRPGRWQIAFMPISIRVGTNRPEEFYQGLALRLSEISGLALDETKQRDAEFFKASVRRQLEHISEKRLKVLVVLDGIDEALEGTFDASVLPMQLPPTLRILISARWQVRDNDSQGWLKRLEWDRDTSVETKELEKLDAQGIADVLTRLGAPMDIVAREPGLVERLTALTEGEPLLVRFYCADLWGHALDGARITVADLDTLKPGFGSYFERWLNHQEQLWKQEGTAIDGDKVDRVLVILAHALGPLSEADLLTLMKEVHGDMSFAFADRLLRPLRRFVMGDGKPNTGFVLCHPKISGYLRAERFHAAEKPVLRAFADWGRRHLAALNSGEIKPEDASRYLLLYLPQHLECAGASVSDFMTMVEDGWRRAWEDLDGGPRGFSDAVRSVWLRLRKDGEDAHLGAQWRCALTLSSIRSLGQNIPGELLGAAVQHGVLSPTQAVHYARLKGVGETVEDLARIAAAAVGSESIAEQLIEETLDCAMSARTDRDRGRFIDDGAKIFLAASGVPKRLVDVFVRSCVRHAIGLSEAGSKAVTLASLVPFMSEAQVELTWKATREIEDGRERIQALAMVRSGVAAKNVEKAIETSALREGSGIERQIVNEMLLAVDSIKDESDRAKALEEIATQLSAEQFDVAVIRADAIGANYSRRQALEALAKCAHNGQVVAILKLLGQGRNEEIRAQVLRALAPRMSEQHGEEAFRLAVSVAGVSDRRESLAAVAHCLNRRELEESIKSVKGIDEDFNSLRIVATLSPRLDAAAKRDAVVEALGSARALVVPSERTVALRIIMPILDGDERRTVVEEAVEWALRISDTRERARALVDLIPDVQDEAVRRLVIERAVEAAELLDDKIRRAGWLVELARYLPPEREEVIVREAYEALERSWNCDLFVYFVAGSLFRHHLAQGQLEAAIQLARLPDSGTSGLLQVLRVCSSIEQRDELVNEALEHATAEDLIELKGYATDTQWKAVVDQRLESVSERDEDGYANEALTSTLETLAPHLDLEQAARALLLVRSLDDNEAERAGALAALSMTQDGEERERLISEARQSTEQMSNPSDRVAVLLRLAQLARSHQGRFELLQAAISTAQSIVAAPSRGVALVSIAAFVSGSEETTIIAGVIQAAAESPRKDAFEMLVTLKEVVPPMVLASARKAVHDASRWYP